MLDRTKLVLITGAHGFIGGHVARKLISLGYNIRVTDIVGAPAFATISAKETIIGNLCDPSFCSLVVQGVDVVLHFAATMGGMGTIHEANDFIIYQENHTMTINLLSACKAGNVQGFFYASSACVYPEALQGSGVDVSLAEGDVWKHPPPHPQGLYGLEKLVSELGLHQYASTLQVRVARFHNVYGPMGSWYGGREKVPAAFLRKAISAKLCQDKEVHFEIWGDGSQRRSFCFIDDAVEAILRLLESDCSEPVNIGSDQAVSVRQLADIALRFASIDPESVTFDRKLDRPQGVGSRNSDNTFVKKTLNWEPQISLEEGMRRTGEWIQKQLLQALYMKTPPERSNFLHLLQSSDLVDLEADAITFAILLPITSRGLDSPEDCLGNLGRFADSLLSTTTDDIARLGERYQFHVYLAIDEDDAFLWGTGETNAAEALLREHSIHNVTTLPPCRHPKGHVCALWGDCARRAADDKCDYYVLMGDDVVLQDANWMSRIHRKFLEFPVVEGVPHGIGCVAFTDTTFPGFPTFPVIHRTHLEIFGGDVLPDNFTNQDGDPFLYQLYRRWGCATMISSRLSNGHGGSGNARYEKVHAAGWTFQTLDTATAAVERWIRERHPYVQQKLTLDVVIPCYRVLMNHLDALLALRPSVTCSVMFIIIVDDPNSSSIEKLINKYGDRPDVRIRVNAQNQGASYSRNRGLLESAAEWVQFLDDDVTPDANLLIEAEKAIRAHPNAAGLVGNAHFPPADTVFKTAVHLAGVTYFWDIAEKIAEDVPWGVTANLIARRNLSEDLTFNLQFPKTGGGEDIDYCRKVRDFSLLQGREGFFAAPAVKVTHPWWHEGQRTYKRFYMWSKGDGGLVKLYPGYTYRDFSPNAAEFMLGSGLVFVMGLLIAFFSAALGRSVMKAGALFGASTMVANVGHDLLRHLVLNPKRVRDMRTTLSGWKWIAAIIEGAVIRVYSEWGRVVGLLERGELNLLLMRFDWFCGVMGEAPKREEIWNNQTRALLTAAVYFAAIRFL